MTDTLSHIRTQDGAPLQEKYTACLPASEGMSSTALHVRQDGALTIPCMLPMLDESTSTGRRLRCGGHG